MPQTTRSAILFLHGFVGACTTNAGSWRSASTSRSAGPPRPRAAPLCRLPDLVLVIHLSSLPGPPGPSCAGGSALAGVHGRHILRVDLAYLADMRE